jgi:hypothetical protein
MLNTNPPIGYLKTGEPVLDRLTSHIAAHPVPTEVLEHALSQIAAEGRDFIREEIAFDRSIGVTTCVVTGPKDKIVYAVRPKRTGATRFVVGREPEPCSHLVVIVKKEMDDVQGVIFVLITIFVGRLAKPEPFDAKAFSHCSEPEVARAESLTFWETRALLFEADQVDPASITDVCPW